MAKVKSSAGPTQGAAGINGAAIASDAIGYVGRARYVFGGAPGTQKGVDAGTDCSGFVSMVLCRDLGIAIPGFAAGAYSGSQHGPVVSDYIAWSGATTLGKNESPVAGDLVCYAPDTHIGIATSAVDFVSALNPSLGVAVTEIAGAASGTIVYRRINGTGAAPTGDGGSSTTSSLGSSLAGIVAGAGLGAGVVGVLVVGILGGAALLGTLGAFLLAAAIRRAGVG
jgi:cell wall-associated NlpC family hydrolase